MVRALFPGTFDPIHNAHLVVAREAAEAMVVLYLSHGHTVFYGQFLEESHGGKYAIIMPT